MDARITLPVQVKGRRMSWVVAIVEALLIVSLVGLLVARWNADDGRGSTAVRSAIPPYSTTFGVNGIPQAASASGYAKAQPAVRLEDFATRHAQVSGWNLSAMEDFGIRQLRATAPTLSRNDDYATRHMGGVTSPPASEPKPSGPQPWDGCFRGGPC